MLFPRKVGGEGVFEVDEDLCTACQQCMKLGCPSLHHSDAVAKKRHKVAIDETTCTGCSLCAQLCAPGAIAKAGERLAGSTR
jgi:indolepyruvate ferredoxin oxidoreductase alpha subunit